MPSISAQNPAWSAGHDTAARSRQGTADLHGDIPSSLGPGADGRPSARANAPSNASALSRLFLSSDVEQKRGGSELAGLREIHLDVLRAAAGRNAATLAAIQALELDTHDAHGVSSGAEALRSLLRTFALPRSGAAVRPSNLSAGTAATHHGGDARTFVPPMLLPSPTRVLFPGGGYPHLGALLTTLMPGSHAGTEVFAASHQPHLAAEMVASWCGWWRHAALDCVSPLALHPAAILAWLSPQGQPTLLLGVYRRLLLATAVAGYTAAVSSAVEVHRLAVVAQCTALQSEMDSAVAQQRAAAAMAEAAATDAHDAQQHATGISDALTTEGATGAAGASDMVARGISASSSASGGDLAVITSVSRPERTHSGSSPNVLLEYSPMSNSERHTPSWGDPLRITRSGSAEAPGGRGGPGGGGGGPGGAGVHLGIMSPMGGARMASDERPMASTRELSSDFSAFVGSATYTGRGRAHSTASSYVESARTPAQGRSADSLADSGGSAIPLRGSSRPYQAGVTLQSSPLARQSQRRSPSPLRAESNSPPAIAPPSTANFEPPFTPERVKSFVGACKKADTDLQASVAELTAAVRERSLQIWCQSDSQLLLLLTASCEGPLALCRCAFGLYQLFECLSESWGVFTAIRLLTAPDLHSAAGATGSRIARLDKALHSAHGDKASQLGVVPHAAISSAQGAAKAALSGGQRAVTATAGQVDAEWAHLSGVVAGVAAAVSFANSGRPTPLFTSPTAGKSRKGGAGGFKTPLPSSGPAEWASPMAVLSPTATPYARTSTKQLQRLMSAASWSQRDDELHPWRPQLLPGDSLPAPDADSSDADHDTDGGLRAHVLSSTQVRLGSTMQLLCRAVDEPMSDREFMLLVSGKGGQSERTGSATPQTSSRNKELLSVLPLSRLFHLGRRLMQGRRQRAAAASSVPKAASAGDRGVSHTSSTTQEHSASARTGQPSGRHSTSRFSGAAAGTEHGPSGVPDAFNTTPPCVPGLHASAQQLAAVLFSQIAAPKAQALLAWCRLMATVSRPILFQVKPEDAQLDPSATANSVSLQSGPVLRIPPSSAGRSQGGGASRSAAAASAGGSAAVAAGTHRRGSQAAARRGSVVMLGGGAKSNHARRSSVTGAAAWGSRRNIASAGTASSGGLGSAAGLGVSDAVLRSVRQKAQALNVWTAAPGADSVAASWHMMDAAVAPAPYKSFMQALWMQRVYEPANRASAAAAAAGSQAQAAASARSYSGDGDYPGSQAEASTGPAPGANTDDSQRKLTRRGSAGDALREGGSESKGAPPLTHAASMGSELREFSVPKAAPSAPAPKGPFATSAATTEYPPPLDVPGPRWLMLPPPPAAASAAPPLDTVAPVAQSSHRATSAVTVIAQESSHVAWVRWGDLRRAMARAAMKRAQPDAVALAAQLTAAAEASMMPAALQAGAGAPHAGLKPWDGDAKNFTVTLTSIFSHGDGNTPQHGTLPLLRTVSSHSFGADHSRLNPLMHGKLLPTVSEWTAWNHEQMKRMARGNGASMAHLLWCAVAESCVTEPNASGDCWVSPCGAAVRWRGGERPRISASKRRGKAPPDASELLPLPVYVPLGLQHVLALVAAYNTWADVFGHKSLAAAAAEQTGSLGLGGTGASPHVATAATAAPLLSREVAQKALQLELNPQALLAQLLGTMGPPPPRSSSSSASSRELSGGRLAPAASERAMSPARGPGGGTGVGGGKSGGGGACPPSTPPWPTGPACPPCSPPSVTSPSAPSLRAALHPWTGWWWTLLPVAPVSAWACQRLKQGPRSPLRHLWGPLTWRRKTQALLLRRGLGRCRPRHWAGLPPPPQQTRGVRSCWPPPLPPSTPLACFEPCRRTQASAQCATSRRSSHCCKQCPRWRCCRYRLCACCRLGWGSELTLGAR